jgi:ABC-type tungstate transport system, permease component
MTQRTRRQVLGGAGAAAMIGIAGCTTGDEGATAEPAQLTEAIGDGELILATTTSTYDTGLLDAIVPTFESAFGMTVKMLPQGTGAAIETARNGDADVLLVHARSREDAFMQAGVRREPP